MLTLPTLALLILSASSSASAQSCPSGSTRSSVTNLADGSADDACCTLPFSTTGSSVCSVATEVINGSKSYRYTCNFSGAFLPLPPFPFLLLQSSRSGVDGDLLAGSGTYQIAAGTIVSDLQVTGIGGTGGDFVTSSGTRLKGGWNRCVHPLSQPRARRADAVLLLQPFTNV